MRQIPATPDKLEAHVEGDIEEVDGVLRIARIRVHYKLRIPAGKREAAERAVNTHARKCPAHNSVQGCIAMDITAEIAEE